MKDLSITLRNNWELEEILELFNKPFNDLLYQSSTIHRNFFDPNEVQISTLLSIKTGGCPENCKYCPQSAHYDTGLEKQALLDVENVLDAARKAKEAGADRFCMGAAWREVNDRDVPQICDMISQVKALGLESCVTLGMATKEQLSHFKNAGLDFYNHNIDSSEEFYSEIISTRNFDDRLKTLQNIANSGLNTCSGGIVGMGENVSDRAKMLQTLANLPKHPRSVPINMLVQVEGTPLHGKEKIDNIDFVRVIAVARILMPQSYVRLSAGRESMSEELQALCFMAGANSIFYGDKLLTTDNPEAERDEILFHKLGLKKSQQQPENIAA